MIINLILTQKFECKKKIMFKEILQILKPRFKCNENEIQGLRD